MVSVLADKGVAAACGSMSWSIRLWLELTFKWLNLLYSGDDALGISYLREPEAVSKGLTR